MPEILEECRDVVPEEGPEGLVKVTGIYLSNVFSIEHRSSTSVRKERSYDGALAGTLLPGNDDEAAVSGHT
jgi:hypothetical protein